MTRPPKGKTLYIHIDQDGETHIKPKGKGRTQTGFIKQAEGKWAGHYVKDDRDGSSR